MLLCDLDGAIRRVLHNALPFAWPAAAGARLPGFLDHASREKCERFLSQAASEAVFDWEMDVLEGDRPWTLSFNAFPFEGHLFVTAAPCTAAVDQHRVLNEFTQLNNDLANTHREIVKKNVQLQSLNEEKTRFLGIAVHDLRSPIATIQAYADFLVEETAAVLQPEHLEFVAAIRKSSEDLVDLITDLLDISAIESGKLTLDLAPGDLAEVVANNVEMNRVLAQRRRVAISFERDGPTLPAVFDQSKMVQVLNNLIGNALKYSPEGGVVTVRLGALDGEARLEVRDEGPGIPANEMSKLFHPFSKTSVRNLAGYSSTGLGLAISRRIVEGHGGRIWAESEKGHGAAFYVALPIR